MNAHELAKNPFARDVALGAAEAFGLIATTVVLNHREIAHQSVETKPPLRLISEAAMFSIGQDPEIWAAVHRDRHHAFPDASLGPLLETADYLEYRIQHSEISDPPIPTSFFSLDPAAELNPNDIRSIGAVIRESVADLYDVPEIYSIEEAQRILDPVTPRYLYPHRPSRRERRRGEIPAPVKPQARTIAAIAPRIRDPHSPTLHEDGVRGILRDNMPLYKEQAAEEQKERRKKFSMGVGPLFIGNIALKVLKRGEYNSGDVIRRVAIGSAVALIAVGGLIAGGNITNGPGHCGDELTIGKPKVKPDGTFSYNAKILSLPTLDEVGGQDSHHLWPWKIAYSAAKGIRKVAEAPFGSLLESMANRNIGLRPGKQFGDETRDQSTSASSVRRPDETHEAVIMLQKVRARTLQRQKAALSESSTILNI